MKSLIALCFFISLSQYSHADSPLTSTNFYLAYDNTMIDKALANNGLLNDELSDFLQQKDQKLEIKIAIVNALGWKLAGKNNATFFLNDIIKKRTYASETDFLSRGTKEELIVYAYLMAMDNYHDVTPVLKICKAADFKNSNSRCIRIINGLIEAQSVLYESYCSVYEIMASANEKKGLDKDMHEEAIDNIFNYINIYKKYCESDDIKINN